MRGRTRLGVVSAVFVLAWLPEARLARAGDPALAETLFREGKALLRAGDFAHACPKLAASYEQDPGTGTLLALARCQEGLGQLATAWSTYRRVVESSEQQGRLDRANAA